MLAIVVCISAHGAPVYRRAPRRAPTTTCANTQSPNKSRPIQVGPAARRAVVDQRQLFARPLINWPPGPVLVPISGPKVSPGGQIYCRSAHEPAGRLRGRLRAAPKLAPRERRPKRAPLGAGGARRQPQAGRQDRQDRRPANHWLMAQSAIQCTCARRQKLSPADGRRRAQVTRESGAIYYHYAGRAPTAPTQWARARCATTVIINREQRHSRPLLEPIKSTLARNLFPIDRLACVLFAGWWQMGALASLFVSLSLSWSSCQPGRRRAGALARGRPATLAAGLAVGGAFSCLGHKCARRAHSGARHIEAARGQV